MLLFSLAVPGLGKESKAGWGRSSSAYKGGCRKVTADPETSYCLLTAFLSTSSPLGRSGMATQGFACIAGGPWISSGAGCASLYIYNTLGNVGMGCTRRRINEGQWSRTGKNDPTELCC